MASNGWNEMNKTALFRVSRPVMGNEEMICAIGDGALYPLRCRNEWGQRERANFFPVHRGRRRETHNKTKWKSIMICRDIWLIWFSATVAADGTKELIHRKTPASHGWAATRNHRPGQRIAPQIKFRRRFYWFKSKSWFLPPNELRNSRPCAENPPPLRPTRVRLCVINKTHVKQKWKTYWNKQLQKRTNLPWYAASQRALNDARKVGNKWLAVISIWLLRLPPFPLFIVIYYSCKSEKYYSYSYNTNVCCCSVHRMKSNFGWGTPKLRFELLKHIYFRFSVSNILRNVRASCLRINAHTASNRSLSAYYRE